MDTGTCQNTKVLSSLWSSKALSDVVVVFTTQPHLVSACLANAASCAHAAHASAHAAQPPHTEQEQHAAPSQIQGQKLAAPSLEDVVWPEGSAVFEAHGVVLCTSSEFFEAQLLTDRIWADQQLFIGGKAASGGSTPRRVIVVGVDSEAEVAAAEPLMCMMYQQHDPKLDPEMRLLMFMLAHKLMANTCMASCVNELAGLDASKLPLHFISSLLQLLDECHFQPISHSLKNLAGRCTQRLLKLLGNASSVANSADRLQEFCCLPFAAVCVWAASDQLQTDSEDTVAWLLHKWVMANGPVDTSNTARMEHLSSLLRVRLLSPTYRHGVLPQLSWYQPRGQLLALNSLEAAGALSGDPSKLQLKMPPVWLSTKPRAASPPATLQVEVQAEQLAPALAACIAQGTEQRFEGTERVIKGLELSMFMQITSQAGGMAKISVHARHSPTPGLWPEGLPAIVPVTLFASTPHSEKSAPSGKIPPMIQAGGTSGLEDFFGVGAVATVQPLLRWSIDGKLKVVAAVW